MRSHQLPRRPLYASVLTLGVLLTTALGTAPVAVASPPGSQEREILLPSAREDTAADTASLPAATAYVGGRRGEAVRYVVTETSNRALASRWKVTWSPKLANAAGTGAVQDGRWVRGALVVGSTVDFSPTRVVEPGPTGFPPDRAEPGAVGLPGYSPLVELPDGTVVNAPHVANASGRADKLLHLDARRAVLQETEGFYEGDEVYYVSFDASDPAIAALEGVTYAPALNAAPGLGENDRSSARSGIVPFVNGRTGVDDPQRQGLGSALLGEGDPLNVVQTLPRDKDYSPLWDVHATAWTAAATAAGQDTRQTDFDDVVELAEDGLVTGPGGAAWGAVGVVVNCPVISIED